MVEVTGRYPVGVPCWMDMAVRDQKGAENFYRTVFGWEFEDNPWHYDRAYLQGKAVAAISGGQPTDQSNWTTYLAAADVDATLEAIKTAGGRVVAEPHDAPTGKLAFAADPTGGTFGLWQGESFHGFQLIDEPGTPCWYELTSKDVSAAADFFRSVFGVEIQRLSEGFDYAVVKVQGRQAFGIYGGSGERPSEGHAAWLTYFAVADTEKAVATVVGNGGTVISEAHDTPYGRMAILADPFGGHFAVLVPVVS
jgi:predicted enzyme related to lactoylglutathione lyase